ncbi:hypothetical protein [Myxosarcina sp. GI1]|uniref:hypothetical protein n=1 Tax=Myxosarcina sp. GI1 TaxID=1541065 RepID=UPI00055A1A8F|nr:hypothetical protein [Myxosarcina sp. GI1]
MKNYKFTFLKTGIESIGTLKVHWEVDRDIVSDDYTPFNITAKKLLKKWLELVREKYPNNLIPIYWFVEVRGDRTSGFEAMPFQHELQKGTNFLDYYSYPIDCETNKPINWLELPVRDKLWFRSRDDKGGFIQQATGWKPSILQPYVYLPSLINSSCITNEKY